MIRIIFWRVFYFFYNPFRQWYWKLTNAKTRGVKCLVVYRGKILLVRLAYAHKKWTVPGGGVKRKETYEEATKREIKEELGIEINRLEKIGDYVSDIYGKIDTVWCFLAVVNSPEFKIDAIEISEAAWCYPDQLLEPHTLSTPKIVAMAREANLL